MSILGSSVCYGIWYSTCSFVRYLDCIGSLSHLKAVPRDIRDCTEFSFVEHVHVNDMMRIHLGFYFVSTAWGSPQEISEISFPEQARWSMKINKSSSGRKCSQLPQMHQNRFPLQQADVHTRTERTL